jgi:hypothetical protein
MKRFFTAFIAALFLAILTGCATKPTVDDGRELNDQLLYEIDTYGTAAAAMRPAIVRSAALADSECNIQYELPFEAATSYGVDDLDTKLAWLRTLGVDEHLVVIAAVRSSGLNAGDIITGVADHTGENALKLTRALAEARDSGSPFSLQLDTGKLVTISPIRLCRGHVLIASPLQPSVQQYHWTQSVHPLEIFHQRLTPDEAVWIALWTQGLSEQGGASMKTYAFMVGAVKWAAVLALGVTVTGAASSVRGAAAVGSSSAGEVAAVQLAGGAASMTAQAAANRASLSGINRVAAGIFDRADRWAFEKMQKLGLDPRAGLSLHAKLVAHGAGANAFLLDESRLAAMRALVAQLPAARRGPPTAVVSPPSRR